MKSEVIPVFLLTGLPHKGAVRLNDLVVKVVCNAQMKYTSVVGQDYLLNNLLILIGIKR